MSNDSRQRAYKARGGGGSGGVQGGGGNSNTQPATASLVQPSLATLVQATAPNLTQATTQSALTQRLPSVFVRPQTGSTFLHPTVLHADSMVQTQAVTQAHNVPVQTQTQVATHTQNTQNILSHTHMQPQAQALLSAHTMAQTDTLVVTQAQGMVQMNPRPLAQSLVYAHPQVLTQSQMTANAQVHGHSGAQGQSQMQMSSQLSQLPMSAQLPTLTRITSLADLIGNAQIDSSPSQQQASKVSGEGLEVVCSREHSGLQDLPHHQPSPVTITNTLPTTAHLASPITVTNSLPTPGHHASPVTITNTLPTPIHHATSATLTDPLSHTSSITLTDTLSHNSPVSLTDTLSHTSPVTLPDTLPTNTQAQLLQTLATLSLPEQLTTAISLQQGGPTLTQAQLLDALTVERDLIPHRTSLGQNLVPHGASVELQGLPVLTLAESLSGRHEHSATPTNTPTPTSMKVSSGSEPSSVSQMSVSQSSSASQQLTAPASVSAVCLSQDILSKALASKPSTSTPTTTTSSLIASNRMLNKLLDTAKPHIPSQVTKAAEIAHLIPTVRPSALRLGDMEDGLDVVYTMSTRSSAPHTTATRTSAPTNATTLRSSGSIFTDTVAKTVSSLQNEGIFGLPANFQANNTTLVLPNSVSHGQIISQRDIDVMQQVYTGSPTTGTLSDQQLEGLSAEVLRVLPTTSKVSQVAPITSCSMASIGGASSPIGIISSLEKNTRKIGSSSTTQVINNQKAFSSLCSPDPSKSGILSETPSRFQGNSCIKSSMITSTDPMFPSVVMTSGCSSPTSLGTSITSKPVVMSQEVLGRGRGSINETRSSHQTLADLLTRGTSIDVGSSSGAGLPLISLSESRLSRTADVLLSELHRSDESDLSLGASLSAASGEELHNTPSGLSADASLVAGIGGDTAPLQGMPSPPLPSFSLPNISADFMVSGSKTCPSSQPHLPTLLSNLATTADLDQFLDNSNMCIDMSSLSESEVSLSAGSGNFGYSPDKPSSSKKNIMTTSSDLTFTNALKAATTNKCDTDDDKQLSLDIELSNKIILPDGSSKVLNSNITRSTTVPSTSDSSQSLLGHSSTVSQDSSSASHKKSQSSSQNKPAQGQSEKRKEMFRKNELLVQQVACFKCRLCSFLSQDKSEMVNHMKERHSQYLSDTDESEEEVMHRSPSKRVKVLVPKGVESQEKVVSVAQESKRITRSREASLKNILDDDDDEYDEEEEEEEEVQRRVSAPSKHCFIKKEVEDSSGRIGIFIKSEPKDVGLFEGRLINKDEEEEYLRIPTESEPTGSQGESDQEIGDEETTDITPSVTNTRQVQRRPGRSTYSKTTTTPTASASKKKTAKGTTQSDTQGIRCDVNGCSLKLKNENNIAYHRKCHVNSMLQCQECFSTKFQSWRDLALHLWRQHLIDMELHKCDKCDYKSYSYSKLMNVHHKIHSDERPSLCDTCGKRFKTPKQLRNHKALHLKKTEAPQHQCEICQRPFSDKRMLRNHQESVHKKVKPFLCNYCGYSTASRSTLKMHMRQHTGEKPFACEKCKYKTSDHNSLRRHKMQHTGVRPYRCPYCDYASIQSTTFKVHLKDKHPGLAQLDGIMFTCGVCSFKTVKRDNYLAHVAEHSRSDGKRMRQAAAATIPVRKGHEPEAILSDLTPTPAPHVVNIDVDSGTVTVESPHHSDFLNAVTVQTPVPGQLIMADQYIYAVDSSVLSQVRGGEGMVQLGDDVVGVPLSLPLQASSTAASSLQGLVYVTTSTQGGQ
ncbi:hypothetical protein Pmani_009721 [Petrolisthes manimaculis]|uniref:C2H2-type domain-containing protein n=1 Tax=Petrolisthes manimaculis TaxID=1843537 RepID=A0AAE1Q2X0_9EUCA|nr:hypothetical protein Pmani_009721 [Petrolisthes manimaculis]